MTLMYASAKAGPANRARSPPPSTIRTNVGLSHSLRNTVAVSGRRGRRTGSEDTSEPYLRTPFALVDQGTASLQQYDVAPATVPPADSFTDTDDPEAGLFVQAEARDVLRGHAGLDRPDAGRLGRLD